MKTTAASKTNNYFRASPAGRVDRRWEPLLSDSPDPPTDKVERVLSRRPRPVDWTRVHFFDDRDPSSTVVAWERARRASPDVCAWRPDTLLQNGPWAGTKALGETPEKPEEGAN